MIFIIFLLGCSDDETGEATNENAEFFALSDEEELALKERLVNTSYRQFEPSKDSNKRKTIIISFFNTGNSIISLWGQEATGEIAISEWEVFGNDYGISKQDNADIYKLEFKDIRVIQILPIECSDCLSTDSTIIYLKKLDSEDGPWFKIEPNTAMPTPFPVFNDWTRFIEDIHIH